MDFQRLQYNDIEGISKLFQNTFNQSPWNEKWIFEKSKTYISDLFQSKNFLGFSLKENDKLIGVCLGRTRDWWSGVEFFIDEFFVDVNHHLRGIGSILINMVIQAIRNDYNVTKIVAYTSNSISQFYIKNGFECNDTKLVIYNIVVDNNV